MHRRSFLAAALVVASLGCGGGKQYWHAQPIVTPGVRIQPKKVTVWGKLLYVDTEIFNGTGMPLQVDRDRVVLMLPNGAVVGRSQGTFTQHKTYDIPPGGSRAVNVDFKAEGFRWKDVQSAYVNFAQAVFVNGAPIALPVMTISPHAMAAQPVPPPPPATAAPAPAPAPTPAPTGTGAPPPGGIQVQGGVEIKM